MKVELKFEQLDHIVRVWAKRGENIGSDLAAPIADALHAEVMEVFETDGYGTWPGFWWQRRGLPKPGTPRPPRPKKPVTLTERQQQNRAKKAQREKDEAARQKKLRAAFGYAYGSVGRRYGGEQKPRTTSRKVPKSHRRWQGEPKLLRDRGIMIGSLAPYTTEDLIEVYTNVPYAKYHVSHEPRHKIPLRDFFDINTAKFEQDIVDMIEVHLGQLPQAAE